MRKLDSFDKKLLAFLLGCVVILALIFHRSYHKHSACEARSCPEGHFAALVSSRCACVLEAK